MNRCEGCPRNCCLNFKLTREITDPIGTREELKKFPYIVRVGGELILDPDGNERIVGIYRCGRFDPATGKCRGYEEIPRPDFCLNTGEKFYPHSKCLLKNEKNKFSCYFWSEVYRT